VIKQRLCDGLIVNGFKETQKTTLVVGMSLVMSGVMHRSNPTHHLTISQGNKCLRCSAVVERMPRKPDHFTFLRCQRVRPIFCLGIKVRWEMKKLLSLVTRGDGVNLKSAQSSVSFGGGYKPWGTRS
jgi:hypothetical protein